MKIKNKGKVYPSPSPSSSSSSSCGDDHLSVLKLLPATILVLASVLSVEDREVLAYLITRSLKTTTTAGAGAGGSTTARTRNPASSSSSSSAVQDSKKKSSKKGDTHKPPVFDCDCFDCYTSYWLRWDSSPNRELIHQAIEAFEDHLTSDETQKPKKNNSRAKKKEKSSRRVGNRPVEASGVSCTHVPETPSTPCEAQEPVVAAVTGEVLLESPGSQTDSPGRAAGNVGTQLAEPQESTEGPPGNSQVIVRSAAESGHRGLARKVLPDVLGLFNSRLWSLWNPNA